MENLNAYFQEMWDKCSTPVDFVEAILMYYKLASEEDKKLRSKCIPKVAATVDKYLDMPVLPGSYIDMETNEIKYQCSIEMLEIKQEYMSTRGRLQELLLQDILPLCKHKQQSFLCPREIDIPLSKFCRNCIEMYFATKVQGLSKLGEYANNCKKLKEYLMDCVCYLIGEMVMLEVGMGNTIATMQLSVEGASLLFYAVSYLEHMLGKQVCVGIGHNTKTIVIDEKTNATFIGLSIVGMPS